MQRLFLSIYGSVIVAIGIVLVVAYVSFSWLNQYRYQQHLGAQLSGTVYLLEKGIIRQKNQADRERWLELVASLMSVKLTLEPTKNDFDTLIVEKVGDSGSNQNLYRVISPIENQQQLVITLSGVTEHVVTGSAFLLLNEIGLHEALNRQVVFEGIKRSFNYPVNRVSAGEANLDSEQIERLQRDEMVIVWQTEFDSGLSIDVFAPWGNTNDLLKLGTIDVFEKYPAWLLALGFTTILSMLAFWIMRLIRVLEKKLKSIQYQVDEIEPGLIQANEMPDNLDVFSQLAWKIDHMAARIARLLKQKNDMIRAVSHDLRTPLAKAQFRLESLAAMSPNHVQLVDKTKNDLQQLNLLISELLNYEKLTESQHIELEEINLTELIVDIVEGVQLMCPDKHCHFDSSAMDINAHVNKQLFARMLENLLNNAARFANKNIEVKLQKNRQYIVIAIIDDGPGIEIHAQSHIFEPFYQQDKSRSHHASGYGLGLAIVKQIAEQHHADVSLLPTKKGAHFEISLPMRGATK